MSRKNSLPDPAVERTRKILAWSFGTLFALVFGAGVLYALGVFDGSDGDDYTAIPGTKPPTPGQPITVVEYFSYACPHCRDFDPQVESFRQDLPAGVTFERVPVVFGMLDQDAQARAYYALDAAGALEENHTRLFAAIHDEGRRLSTDDEIARVVDGHGIDAARFVRMANAGPVLARVADARAAQERDGVTSIPMLVVAGHYRIEIGRVGRARAIEIAERLVQAQRAPGGGT